MKTKLQITLIIMVSCLFSTILLGQQNLEVEDGKLIVNRINLQSAVEIQTSGANADAVLKFGDDSVANDAILGWDGGEEVLKLTVANSLDNGGLTMKSINGGRRIGFGSLPDDDAKIMVNYNSNDGLTPRPQLLLRENNNSDFARLHFGNFGLDQYWQLAGKASAGSDAEMQFYYHDGTDGETIMTIDGESKDVTINDGELTVNADGGTTSRVEIITQGAASDALVEFGDDGAANNAVVGWDGGDDMLKLSVGSVLDNTGIMLEEISNSSRIGLGTLPDPDAKVIINYNSDAGGTPEPQLLLEENNNSDYARLQFGNFGVSDYWHINALSSANSGALMNIFYRDGSVGDNIVTIDGNEGIVGIQRTPQTNQLEVNGTASKTTAGDWLGNSDRRIKTDIQNINNSFETLLKLRPVIFKYTDEWKSKNPTIKDHYYYNFIAQEYAEVFPESVQGSGEYIDGDDKEILQIDTYNAQIVNISATQELIRENIKLKEELANIKLMMQDLNEVYTSLQNDVLDLRTNPGTTHNNTDTSE